MFNLGNSLALRWATRSGLAVTEQLTVAGANFCLNVAFARWGPAVEYGGFALVQSLFLFSATIYTAAFTEPMMVFVHRHFQSQRQGYYLTVLKAQGWFSVVAFLLFLLAALVLEMAGFPVIGRALIGFAFAGPSLLVFGLIRRVWYCESRPARSAVAAILYFVLLMAMLALLVRFHALTSISALLATSVSAGIATACLFISFGNAPADERPPMRDVVRLHWEYARWSFASGIAVWIPANIGSIVLPLLTNLTSVGVFRALLNLTQPATQVVAAVSAIVLPALSKRDSHADFWVYSAATLSALAGFGIFYGLALVISGGQLVHFVYGGRFDGNENVVTALSVFCLFQSFVVGANLVLRARARPDWIFYGTLACAVSALFCGMAGGYLWGMTGLAWSLPVAYSVNGFFACLFLLRSHGRHGKRGYAS